MLIFLIGMPASGKTHFGKLLADWLGYEFFDTDQMLADSHATPIGELFETLGEAEFRKEEAEMLNFCLGEQNMVVATGGGLAAYGNNMERMNEAGTTVWLKSDPGLNSFILFKQAATRPLFKDLTIDGARERYKELLKIRLPFYMQAKVAIDTKYEADELIEDLAASIMVGVKAL